MINNGCFLGTTRKTELSRYVYILKSVTATEAVLSVSKDFGATFQEKTIAYPYFTRDVQTLTTCESGKHVMLVLSKSAGSLVIHSRDHGSTFNVMESDFYINKIQLFNDGLAAFYAYIGAEWMIRLTKDYTLQTYAHQISNGYLFNRASKDEIFIQISSARYLFNVYTHQQQEIVLPVDRYYISGGVHYCFMYGSINKVYRSTYGIPGVNDYTEIPLMSTIYDMAIIDNGSIANVLGYLSDVAYKITTMQSNGAVGISYTEYTWGAGYGSYQLGRRLSDTSFSALICNGQYCYKLEMNGSFIQLTTGVRLAVNANYAND